MAQVLVKYINGETKTGRVLSFNINQPVFYLEVQKEGKTVSSAERMDNVKEILFLKKEEFPGSLVRNETIGQSVFAGTVAFRLRVEFQDGSVLTGTAIKYNPSERGFYLIPLNPADKSERIFVNARAAKHVESMKLFGKILVDQKKITEEQLEVGIRKQQEYRAKRIGDILQEKSLISEEQLRESLGKQKENQKLLGEILLEAGYITSDQLDYALRIQIEHRERKLGRILVDLKFLTPNDICIALATQFQCAWIDLSEVTVQAGVAKLLPEEVVKRLEVIPVEKKMDGVLVVATSQPQNPLISAEVGKATPLKVELAVAYEEYIARNIAAYFPGKQEHHQHDGSG